MTKKQQTELNILFTEAHYLYKGALRSYANFKVNNKMLSEDLVQNTFIKTWIYLTKGGKIQRMKTFLYHVLNNLIIDEYRKRKLASLDSLMEKGFEPVAENENSSTDFLDNKNTLKLVEDLPETYKNIVYMKYFKDMSAKEISLETGLSKNTVAVRLHRGIEKLKLSYVY